MHNNRTTHPDTLVIPMFSLNNYVPEVAVISMNPERLKKVAQEFKAIHTTFKPFPGVRATRDDVRRFGNDCKVICPADSAIGCLMAHRQVWEYMIQKGMPCIAVFEDDVRFAENFADVFPKAFAELPVEWDLLYLGCQTCADTTWMDGIICAGFQKMKTYSPHLVIPPIMIGAEAYIISQRGAQKLLEWTRNDGFHLDFLISKHKDSLEYFSVFPQVAYQSADEHATSANTTVAPVLLNESIKWIQMNPKNPYDTRSLDWVLTINIFKIEPFGFPITGWWFIFILLALISSYMFGGLVIYILIESAFYPNRWKAYMSLLLALGIGFGFRNIIGSLIK